MFAVIKTGGKQYKVAADDKFTVEKLAAEAGETVQFNDVLMLGGSDGVTVGAPFVAGAAVQAEVVEQTRGPKVVTFKKRRRKHSSQRKKGHRQHLTLVKVTEILANGADKSGVKAAVGAASAAAVVAAAPAPKKAAAKKAAPSETTAEKPAETAAPAAAGDDLTKLTGVGPKMAATMAEAGVTGFAQMAGWSEDEIAAMDETLNAKGKLAGWVEQAKTLAGEDK